MRPAGSRVTRRAQPSSLLPAPTAC